MFGSIEFYVVAVFVAAAVIGLAAMPRSKGQARTFLYSTILSDSDYSPEPGIEVCVDIHGRLELHRAGLGGVAMDGACSLAVTIVGFDVTIEERLTPGRRPSPQATSARALIDCLGAERYHFLYRSEATGRCAAFRLNIHPGNRVRRLLG